MTWRPVPSRCADVWFKSCLIVSMCLPTADAARSVTQIRFEPTLFILWLVRAIATCFATRFAVRLMARQGGRHHRLRGPWPAIVG